MAGIADKVDKADEGRPLSELVEALQGVSAGDAEQLKAAFDIKIIGDVGPIKYFLWAQSIAKLAEYRLGYIHTIEPRDVTSPMASLGSRVDTRACGVIRSVAVVSDNRRHACAPVGGERPAADSAGRTSAAQYVSRYHRLPLRRGPAAVPINRGIICRHRLARCRRSSWVPSRHHSKLLRTEVDRIVKVS